MQMEIGISLECPREILPDFMLAEDTASYSDSNLYEPNGRYSARDYEELFEAKQKIRRQISAEIAASNYINSIIRLEKRGWPSNCGAFEWPVAMREISS
jgi:hypothetical protein